MVMLVTGSNGRIGRYLVDALLARGDSVRCFIRPGAPKLWKDAEYVVGDITNKSSMAAAMKDVNTVFHLAALVAIRPRDLVYKVNIDGTRNLLEAARGKRFVYLSSCAVYGANVPKPCPETAGTEPFSVYGKSKLEGEKLVLAAGGIGIRAPVVYGRGFREGFYNVFGFLEKKMLPIIGSGKNRLHYVHASDLVDGVLLAEKRGRAGEAYNIAGPEMKTQEELMGIVARNLGVPPPSWHVPVLPALVAAKLYTMKNSLARKKGYGSGSIGFLRRDDCWDLTKARGGLGYEPKIGYEQGIKEMTDEYKGEKSGGKS